MVCMWYLLNGNRLPHTVGEEGVGQTTETQVSAPNIAAICMTNATL